MNTQKTVDQMEQLKVHGMAKLYRSISEQPIHQQPEPHALVGMLTEAEIQTRQQQKTQQLLRISKLRYHALLEQVNATAQRGLSKENLLQFSDGQFITKGENILITGSTGCGKSYLACALGRQACMLGYRTLYLSMNRFIESVANARLDGTYVKWLNQIGKIPLIILDDFGLQSLDHNMKITLLQILEDRYAKGATIITSQLPIKLWYDYIAEPTLADAIMDRLAAYAHKIELKGESLRIKN
ncbi:MAG: IS21-like element helper ATPase IstB [Bacteroidetes bacterium]|nr:IS21-like element helper ATPase IstB [Bacteroidota bacterium]